MNEFERCQKNGKIVRVDISLEMVEKEMASATYDLSMAEESFNRDDFKWASIQAYYAMFHAAKALVFSRGYREKSHYCLIVALRALFIENRELEKDLADGLEMCMDIRHEADYRLSFGSESAEVSIEHARKFIDAAGTLLYA